MELTQHAIKRSKERLNLNEVSLLRLAEKALEVGKKHHECKGKIRKYLDKLWLNYKTCNNPRIRGEVLFLFKDEKLITLYQIPLELRRWVKI